MGRIRGQRERPSERKRQANAQNGRRPRLASRRGSPNSEAVLRQSLEALRELTPRAVALLKKALAAKDIGVAVRAASEVCDRAGLPRRSESLMAFVEEPPKLFDMTPFEPPPSYSEEPPTRPDR